VIFLSTGSVFKDAATATENKTRMFHMEKKVWCDSQDLPIPTESHALVTYNGRVIVIGGGHGNWSTWGSADAFAYDPQKDQYTKLADLTENHFGQRAAVLDGKIYAIGGRTKNLSEHHMEIYDGNVWKQGPIMLDFYVEVAIATTANGVVWSVGGFHTEYLDTNESNPQWKFGPKPIRDQFNLKFAAVSIGNTVYSCGGNEEVTSCEKLESPAVNWVKIANLQKPRIYFDMLLLDGKIYAVGGEPQDENHRTNSIEVYDPQADQWSMFAEWEEDELHFGLRGRYTVLTDVPESSMRCP